MSITASRTTLGSNVAVSGAWANVLSLSLGAGEWIVFCNAQLHAAAGIGNINAYIDIEVTVDGSPVNSQRTSWDGIAFAEHLYSYQIAHVEGPCTVAMRASASNPGFTILVEAQAGLGPGTQMLAFQVVTDGTDTVLHDNMGSDVALSPAYQIGPSIQCRPGLWIILGYTLFIPAAISTSKTFYMVIDKNGTRSCVVSTTVPAHVKVMGHDVLTMSEVTVAGPNDSTISLAARVDVGTGIWVGPATRIIGIGPSGVVPPPPGPGTFSRTVTLIGAN